MEEWNFPPNYRNDYFPDANSPYWFRDRETMDPEKRDELIVARIREVMAYAYDHSPFYQRKWDEAGIKANDIRTLADFEEVPVVTKQELRDSQAKNPPFGDYLCCPESDIHHIHGTSGTTGRPTAFGISRRDWETIANNHARIMWGMGLRPGDTV
ncbi:MAG: phenylacetate--CoA ligase, partial [Marinobacter sp.]|nr:phenylacetate--CoA ligase [Marinobacter sp.]